MMLIKFRGPGGWQSGRDAEETVARVAAAVQGPFIEESITANAIGGPRREQAGTRGVPALSPPLKAMLE